MSKLKKVPIWRIVGGIIILIIVIQLIPYGRNHQNPPVQSEPAWYSPETRELAVRACYDCHSNETIWPWYSNIAPLSWQLQRSVSQGRSEINFSEWNRPQKEANESAEKVVEGGMPPWNYVILHPSARLSSSEKAALVRGLEATFGRKKDD